jgi:protocatechuate 3,4-dioxygenase beta subunit
VSRLVLAAAVVATLAVAAPSAGKPVSAAARCAPTFDDGAGPFGRGEPPQRAKIGTGHVLNGTVLSVDCLPVPGARIHLWQTNRRGEYTRATSATVVANRLGRFRFEGPRPTSYEGRRPHIHLRIVARDHEVLLTRYEPRPGARTGSIRLVLTPARL